MFLGDDHSIAAALSHVALRDGKYDGIEFLDTKTKSCYNYALSPAFADKLILDTVLHCKATNGESISIYATGKVIDGKLSWKQFETGDIWWHNPDSRPKVRPFGAKESWALDFQHADNSKA